MVYIYYEFCSKGYNYRRERLRGISRHQFTVRDIQTLCMRLCEVVQQGLGGKVGGITRDQLVERYKPKFPHPHQYHCCSKDWKRRERKISVSTKVQIIVWGSANLGS